MPRARRQAGGARPRRGVRQPERAGARPDPRRPERRRRARLRRGLAAGRSASSASRASSTSACCAAPEIFETVETPRDLRERVSGRGPGADPRARRRSTAPAGARVGISSATCRRGSTRLGRDRAHHPRPRRRRRRRAADQGQRPPAGPPQGLHRRSRRGSHRRSRISPSGATSPRSWCASAATSTSCGSSSAAGGPVGKQIEFLLQETHREINTIGSKVNQLEITRLVVEAKGEVERLREQVQNVE